MLTGDAAAPAAVSMVLLWVDARTKHKLSSHTGFLDTAPVESDKRWVITVTGCALISSG